MSIRVPNPALGYVAWHDDAKRRAAEGQKQVRCKRCGLFRWRGEMCKCTKAGN